MIRIRWNVTRLYTGGYYVIKFWVYDKEEGSYLWKQQEIKSIHKLRDPKRLFLRYPKYPFLASLLKYKMDYREFEVTEEELTKGFTKGFPGIDL